MSHPSAESIPGPDQQASETISEKSDTRKRVKRAVGVITAAMSIAVLSVGSQYADKIEDSLRGQEHPQQTRTEPIDASRRARLDSEAALRASQLIDPGNSDVSNGQASIADGRLTVSGTKKVFAYEALKHVPGVARSGRANQLGYTDYSITFSSAPTAADPAAVRNFLATGPHLKTAHIDRRARGSNSFEAGVSIDEKPGTAWLSLTVPFDEGYIAGKPNKGFYELPFATQADVIVLGGELTLGQGNGFVDTLEEAS